VFLVSAAVSSGLAVKYFLTHAASAPGGVVRSTDALRLCEHTYDSGIVTMAELMIHVEADVVVVEEMEGRGRAGARRRNAHRREAAGNKNVADMATSNPHWMISGNASSLSLRTLHEHNALATQLSRSV
jgi:hypothetical protein